MITSKTYLERLDEIKHLDYSNYQSNPDQEKIFYVDLDTRRISVPTQFQDLAVVGDHGAETVWFAVNRYFDGEDLSLKTWGVQAIDAASRSMLLFIEAKQSPVDAPENTTLIDGKDMLLLGWPITIDITSTAGPIVFSLCCFDINEDKTIAYRLGTEQTSCQIKNSIYITDKSENLVPSASRIEELITIANDLLGDAGKIQIRYDQIYRETRPTINGVELRPGTVSEELNIKYNDLKEKPSYHIDGQAFIRNENIYDFESSKFKNISFSQINKPPTMNGEALTETTDICYKNLADKPVIQTDDEGFIIGIDEYEISKVKVDDTLSIESANPVQNQVITNKLSTVDSSLSTLGASIAANQSEINQIKTRLDKLSVVPIDIKAFTANQTMFEVGYVTKENDLIFSWKLSKTPDALTLNETTMNNDQNGSFSWPAGLAESTPFTLVATSTGSEADAVLNIDFTYNIYYGATTIPAEFNKDFINTLTAKLQTSQEGSFNVTAENSQYIYYVVPTAYKECSFSYGGFTGGFKKVADKVKIINDYGVEIEYDFYQSDNPSLGVATITVAKKGE